MKEKITKKKKTKLKSMKRLVTEIGNFYSWKEQEEKKEETGKSGGDLSGLTLHLYEDETLLDKITITKKELMYITDELKQQKINLDSDFYQHKLITEEVYIMQNFQFWKRYRNLLDSEQTN